MYFNRKTNKYERVLYPRSNSKPLPSTASNSSVVSDSVKILQCNVRGLKSKKASLEIIRKEVKPSIIVLSETLLKPNEKPKMGHSATFFRSRSEKSGGGLMTSVSNVLASGTVQVYSGKCEILVTRTESMKKPLTLISVYGMQEGNKKEEVQAEFDEIGAQMVQAKARGDLCVVTGDLNRHIGDLIEGNDNRVSFGGQLWRNILHRGDFVLVNAMKEKVKGGPFTWHRPGGAARSALSLWIVCNDTLPHVESLAIDDKKEITPFRVTGRRGNKKKVYSDHNSTTLTLNQMNKAPPRFKRTAWSMKNADWKYYREETREAGIEIANKIESIEDVEKIDKLTTKVVEGLYRKCFKKVTIKSPKTETNVEVIEDKVEAAAKMNREEFEEEIEKIKEQGAKVGKIYALRNLVHGKKNKQKQVPAAVEDSETGEMKYSTNDIKEATVKHIKETLRDREPLPRHVEIAEHRKEVINTAMQEEKEKRIQFSEEEMEKVINAMSKKSKDCHRPMTKTSPEFRTAILKVLNKYSENEKIPTSFTETSLTQLKKPKGAFHDLGSYRFIHTKSWLPRTLEALVTERIKPVVYSTVSPYQLGGIKNTQPTEHLYLLKLLMMLYAEHRVPLWLSTYDMSKFFDIQRWDDSTVTLIAGGMDGSLLRLYEAITRDNRLQVLTPAGPSDWFTTKHLTPQGSSYGALVSSLNLDFSVNQVMAVMAEYLSSFNNIELRSLQFQDDIAKLSTNKAECQLSQEAIAEMIESKQLVLNGDKCKVMILGKFKEADRARQEMEKRPITMAGKKVITGDNEKYLGDFIRNTTVAESVDYTVEQRLRSVAGPILEILALAEDVKSSYIGPVATASLLWEAVLIKKILNNAESWIGISPVTMKKLESVQTNFFKRLLRLPRTAPTLGIWWEAGCLPMHWRVIMEKLKFAQRLEWKQEENLAGRLWKMEKEGKITGLKTEIEEYINKYQLPPPTKLLSKEQYKKVLKRTIKTEARLEMRQKLLESSKLAYLSEWDQKQGPQMTMVDLERIRMITRCRLGCNFAFSGDFGSGIKCRCGEIDTIGHVRRGCPLYADLIPTSTEYIASVEKSELVFAAVLERRQQLKDSDRAARGAGRGRAERILPHH